MSLSLIQAQAEDLEMLIDFERKRLADTIHDATELEFASWHSRGRRESFEHYLKAGWSFVAFDGEDGAGESREMVGYFLAQPFLFFEGLTQTLWVEHLQFSTLKARDELCDLAYQLAREKHFQAVYFPNNHQLSPVLKTMKSEEWNPKVLVIPTTKR